MRAAAAGGMSDGTCGLGAGMRGGGGWDEGTDGGVVCDGATGTDGFTSAGVFAAAGRTGFGSTSIGAGGSFCAAAGPCGICTGGSSGFFSEGGNQIGAGSLTCAGKSTRCVGTGVSFPAGAAGAAGPLAGFTTNGAAG